MAKGKLFEYAVIHHPKAKKDVAGNEEPVKSVVLTDVTRILAAPTTVYNAAELRGGNV